MSVVKIYTSSKNITKNVNSEKCRLQKRQSKLTSFSVTYGAKKQIKIYSIQLLRWTDCTRLLVNCII